jgi:hypothetical protein
MAKKSRRKPAVSLLSVRLSLLQSCVQILTLLGF